MASNLSNNLRQAIIIGEDSTAVTVTAQGFAGEKTGGGHGAEVAGFAPLIGCTEALRCILYDREVVFFGYGIDGVEICTLAVQGHWDNRLGAWSNGGFYFRWIKVVCAWVDVHVHRLGPEHSHGLGGGNEGETGSDDLEVEIGRASCRERV